MIGRAVLIAGPTASGKSALALAIAERSGGVVVNTDSMQVYGGLRILTARPDEADLQRAPHRLFGHVSPTRAYSTGQWLRDVEALGSEIARSGQLPIFVGGTGLYFRALLKGLSQMPDIPPTTRERWRYRLAEEGPQKLHLLLLREDRDTALALAPNDGQRIVRALEVLDASGRSIREWQAASGSPAVDPERALRFVFDLPRDLLVERIDARVEAMVEAGVLDEVRALRTLDLDPDLPASRAIGVPEFSACVDGRFSLPEAIARTRTATRQYAKRQTTWFRNQMSDAWTRIGSAEMAAVAHDRAMVYAARTG